MKNTFFTLILLAFFTANGNAQQTPAPKQNKTISIVGATLHIGNGEKLENATIIFQNGIITQVGKSENTPAQGEIIDAKNKHVYPGLIIPNSTLGLGEIDAVKASIDFDETGEMLPHVRSLIAYNAESKVVESVRPNGVLLAQITPRGGIISGTSSVVQLDAWNWEDAAVKIDDGIHVNWPNIRLNSKSKIKEVESKYYKNITTIKDFLLQAKTYNQSNNKTRNLELEAAKKLFTQNQRLFIHAQTEKQITDAIDFANELGLKNTVIVNGDEAYKVMGLLKKNHIPVIVKRVHSLPNHEDDDYDLPYKLPVILTKNGITVALQDQGRMDRMETRNLPFYAGTTTGHGLNDEEALKLITLNPAIILGIDKKYGSLEVGKSATLFISKGNALDMRTNQLSHAFIDGRNISLETHQTKLWKRYMKKYESE